MILCKVITGNISKIESKVNSALKEIQANGNKCLNTKYIYLPCGQVCDVSVLIVYTTTPEVR